MIWPPHTASEHEEQSALIRWYDREYGDQLLFAVPNGGKRNIVTAVRLRLEGVRPGVPDLCLPVARNGKHGLYIEMKRQRGDRLRAAQKAWIKRLIELGYEAVVCRGAEAAARQIEAYLGPGGS